MDGASAIIIQPSSQASRGHVIVLIILLPSSCTENDKDRREDDAAIEASREKTCQSGGNSHILRPTRRRTKFSSRNAELPYLVDFRDMGHNEAQRVDATLHCIKGLNGCVAGYLEVEPLFTARL